MVQKRDLTMAALAVASVALVLLLGQVATFPNLEPWYAGLAKPFFNPPNWVFGPVWATLYGLMAFALWRALRAPSTRERKNAVALFYAQLALNAAWSWMFFAAQSPLLGLVNIVPQLIVILAMLRAFKRVDRLACFCLVPLAVWVGFATLLNFAIWRLNG